MAFKLGKENRGFKNSSNTQIFKKKLDVGIIAEANMDGSIFVSYEVPEGSNLFEKAVAHEMQHVTDMKIGKTTYDDNAVYHMGEVWPRGDGYITDPHTGKKYAEGDRNLPWENNKL
jgi:hypothetical protein